MKKNIRKRVLAQRQSLSNQEFWALNEELLKQVSTIDWSKYKYVHLFLPIRENREIDTFELISFFRQHYPQLKIVVPRSDLENHTMQHILFDHEYTILKKNKYHIPEPVYGIAIAEQLIDVVLVPLLAVDSKGNRIGYGGGFYDRFLARCRADCQKIGLSLFPIAETEFFSEEFDVRLNACITPKLIHYFC